MHEAGPAEEGRREWEGRELPYTSSKSVDWPCCGRIFKTRRTLPMDATTQCTIKGGTERWGSASGGTAEPPMVFAETSSMITSGPCWTPSALPSGRLPWTPTTRQRQPDLPGGSTSYAATGQDCSGPSWTPSFWGTTSAETMRSTNDELWTTSLQGTSSGRRTFSDWNWAGITQESSQTHGEDCGSNYWSASIEASMLTQHPDPQAPPKPGMDEYNQFWGLPPPASEGMDPLDRQAELQRNKSRVLPLDTSCDNLANGQERQGTGCLMHELNDFWQFPSSNFSTNFQDFQCALQLQQHGRPSEHGQEPVPVPSPAAQEGDFSNHDNSFLCGGEGWRSSRAAWSLQQPQSTNNQQTNHVNPGRDLFKTVKRAYRRACKRANAAAAGGTWYKGQWMTASALRSQYVTDIPRQVPTRSEGRQKPAGYKHYNFMSWNAGGLASNTWDALQLWLAEHSVDICCIQETHWPMAQEWHNSKYHVFHHGQGRAGGLMTLVRTTVADKNHIRSGTLANGRIQHTRIVHQHGGIDIINVYQKVWSHGDVSSLLSQRLIVWTALAKCLDGLPARNQVIVAGDMNTQLPQHTKVTGPAVPKRAYRDNRDEHELLDILRVKNMVAVNTFRAADPYTYVGPSSETQIDYIFMRNTQAIGHSKEAHGLHGFPLLAARGEGYHVPLWARLPSRWRVWKYNSNTPGTRGPSKDDMASYVQQHSAFVCSQIDSAIGHGSGCEAPTTLDDLDGAMMQVQSQLQSIVPSSSVLKPKPWQDETLRGTLSTAWRRLHQARAETGNGLRSLFNAWRHAHQFLKLITSTRKHCRRLRRARLLSFLDEAQEQANVHNIHGVFKVINKSAPRNLQRPQIRHTDGTLMDAEQESQATAAYLQEVYQDNSRPSFPTDLQAAGIPFTCEELRESISAIPARKAGPRHLACNVFYKHSAASVAPILYGFLQQWWDGGIPYVPQPFKDAWLTMLPKPGRVCKSPSDLRPIGLSLPLGKSILRVLRSKILPYADAFMDNVPQWGFMPGREVSDALSRAFQHCASVRKQCKAQTPSLNRRWEGVQSRALVGGLAIALDISKAFDTIPRAEIFMAMADAQIPDNLRVLVMMWLEGALQGADGTLAVNVRRGVRQGCVLSPLLYVLVVARIHRKLQASMGAEADQMLDYYADDTLFHAEFDTLQGFRLALAKAEKLLEHLDKAGWTSMTPRLRCC